MMTVNPYLNFTNNCREAFRFYAKLFGGKDLQIMSFADAHATEGLPKSAHKLVMHAKVTLGQTQVMGSDAPGSRYKKPQGLWVSISVDTPKEADRIFKGLARDGKSVMPIQETFWAKRFGMVVDRFGTPWMVNCEKPM